MVNNIEKVLKNVIEALETLDNWLKDRHFTGLTPNEKQTLEQCKTALTELNKYEGWVSVPIEPTKEMQEAAIDNYNECPDCISWTGIYKAMIQAALTDKE